jgi:hypothetical protein
MARYSKSASKDVKGAMERRKAGTLKSGKSGKTVKSKKQAIAIGLSEARAKGKRFRPRNPLDDFARLLIGEATISALGSSHGCAERP